MKEENVIYKQQLVKSKNSKIGIRIIFASVGIGLITLAFYVCLFKDSHFITAWKDYSLIILLLISIVVGARTLTDLLGKKL